jgi:hypothetical protein
VIQEFTDDKDAIRRAVKRATDGSYPQYVHDSERVLARLEEYAQKESVMPTGGSRGPAAVAMNQMMTRILAADVAELRSLESTRQGAGLLKLAQAQTGLQGRKTVIYFCQGLNGSSGIFRIPDIVSAANRNNVTFYPIDLRGLKSVPIIDPSGLASENTYHGELISTQMALDALDA